MTSLELYYFPIRGRCEPIRLILEAKGIPYTTRAPQNWPEEKPYTPFQQLPVMTIVENGQATHLAQASAIARYLARRYGLIPEDPMQAALCDSYWESIIEAMDAILTIIYRVPPEQKPQAQEAFVNVGLPSFVKSHSAILERNGNNGHYCGDSLTYVDLALYSLINTINETIPNALTQQNAGALFNLYQKVSALPNIQAYHASPRYLAK